MTEFIYKVSCGEALFIGTERVIMDYLNLQKPAIIRMRNETENGGVCRMWNVGRRRDLNVDIKRETL